FWELLIPSAADRGSVLVEHRGPELPSALIVLPTYRRHAQATVRLRPLIGAKISFLDRVPVGVVLPAHGGHASILVLGALAVGSEVGLLNGLSVRSVSPSDGGDAAKPVARRATIGPEVALLERVALSVIAPANNRHAAPSVGLQLLVCAEMALFDHPPLTVVPPAHDGQTGGFVFHRLSAGAQIPPLDRITRPVVPELDRIDTSGIGCGLPIGSEKPSLLGATRVLDADGRYSEGGIGSRRTATLVVDADNATVFVVETVAVAVVSRRFRPGVGAMDRIAIVEIDVGVATRLGPDGVCPAGGATRQGGCGDAQDGQDGAVLIHASPHAAEMLHLGRPWGNFSRGLTGLRVEGSFGFVSLFMGDARGIVVRAHDDMTHGMTTTDPTQLHRASLIRGPARFGPRYIAAEARTKASTHAVTPREQIEGVPCGV